MAANPVSPLGGSNILRFGIELEMGLKPPASFVNEDGKPIEVIEGNLGGFVQWLFDQWEEFATDKNAAPARKKSEARRDRYARHGITTKIRVEDGGEFIDPVWRAEDHAAKRIDPNYKGDPEVPAMPHKWTIIQDGSLEPLYELGACNWSRQAAAIVEDMYEFLTEHCKCEIVINDSCSTHVHVSPTGKYNWDYQSLDTVKRILCAYFVFEPAIQTLLPPSRRGNQYTRELRNKFVLEQIATPEGKPGDCAAQLLQGDAAGVQTVLENLRTTTTLEEFKEKVNPTNFKHPGWMDIRYYAWNLSNIYVDKKEQGSTHHKYWPKKQTLEFRRPPGSKTAADAMSWVEFVVIFVLQACATPLASLGGYHGTITSLREFLEKPLPEASEDDVVRAIRNQGSPWERFQLPNGPTPKYDLFFEDTVLPQTLVHVLPAHVLPDDTMVLNMLATANNNAQYEL
ncbi:unnamed protein product [Penicillium glandicola]